MAKDVQGSIIFLEEAQDALEEIEIEKGHLQRLESEEKKLSRTLANEKRVVEDEIASTIAKRKEEITSSYDKEITKSQEKLKKARAKRSRAKEKGVKNRVQQETAQLVEENRQLKEANVTNFHKNKIPSFCNTKLYFALYFTKNISDFLLLLLCFAVSFVLIPCGIYFLIPKKSMILFVLIYVVDIVLMLLIYIGLNNRTKVEHLETMKEVRKNRDMIEANNRKIRSIKKSIEKDKNEDAYRLERYDEEIDLIRGELDDLANRKQEALTIFENETQHELDQDIRLKYTEKLETIAAQLRDLSASVKESEDVIQQKNMVFTDQYGPYIGQEFMTPEKIDQIAEVLREGIAFSISDAQQVIKDSMKK